MKFAADYEDRRLPLKLGIPLLMQLKTGYAQCSPTLVQRKQYQPMMVTLDTQLPDLAD